MNVLELAASGWHLIAMQKGSKNPGSLVGEAWQTKATSDAATIKTWSDLGLNFGVLLGSLSGVIDVEYDSDEGEAILAGSAPTLSYKSAKSLHRIYKWDSRFEHERANFGHKGTEWRFGQNKAQSVIPPSLHVSGARYEWVDLLPVAELPDTMWQLFLKLKDEKEHATARERPVSIAPRDRTGDSLIDLGREECKRMSWESLLSSKGWTFARNRGDAQDWFRPGKKGGTISGTVNYGGTDSLRVFSTNCTPLSEESSYDKFAFQCVLDFNDDPIAAAKAIVPQEMQDKMKQDWIQSQSDKAKLVDISQFMVERSPDTDDEEFCESIMPKTGLLAEIAEYVSRSSYKPSPVFSLATAISFCQTIFGRKAKSETGLRTNDFHLVLAPTSAGKEGPIDAMVGLLSAAGHASMIMPGSVSGATAMLDCLANHPQHIQNWVCDEFGYVLSVMLDKKARDPHARGIAKKMLELYGKSKSIYTGGAFAQSVTKHAMHQPHLCAFGVSTGFTVFKEISEDQVHDGLLGRISFWSLQRRPKPNRNIDTTVPECLSSAIRDWIEFTPPGPTDLEPHPKLIPFDDYARARWRDHEEKINDHSDSERAIRASMWGRTAARSMKLALTHRLARLQGPAEINEFNNIRIELTDVDWAIAVSNHCTRLACSMIRETVADTSGNRLSEKVLSIVKNASEGISKAELNARLKSSDAGSIWAAVTELSSSGTLTTWSEPTKGRPKIMVGVVRGDNLA